MSNIGVVVGRFQIDQLHDGHQAIIRQARVENDGLLVIVGDNPLPTTAQNPLSVGARIKMVEDYLIETNLYQQSSVTSLPDHPDDQVWSERLDEIIQWSLQEGDTATIYHGRDTTATYYSGSHPMKEIDELILSSSTNRRAYIGKRQWLMDGAAFRRGVIWANQNRFPTVYSCVDAAVIWTDYDKDEEQFLLLITKDIADGWMFPGGFAELNMTLYFEMREGAKWDEAVFFGLQMVCLKHLTGVRVDANKIREAKEYVDAHMGPGIFFEEGWQYIARYHAGRLPIIIRSVPEGSVNKVGTVLFTIEVTDEKCAWLLEALETLLVQVWYPCTVATLSREVKKDYAKYMTETLGATDGIEFMLHDFGCRGVSSMESAEIGGLAHLVNFCGTDTVPALAAGKNYYDADLSTLGFSVPASEHAIMTSLGEDGEAAIVQQILDECPTGIVSIVIDSFDPKKFITDLVCDKFRMQIIERDGKFVVRPDSPTAEWPMAADQMVWIYKRLWDEFGGTYSPNGYKILDDHVGVLWGDGIDHGGITHILMALKNAGFATTNVSGMGGGLLQKVNRDTQRCAMKCSAQKRGGVWHDIQKKAFGKVSKPGRFLDEPLEVVFRNGELVRRYTFEEVRENARLN